MTDPICQRCHAPHGVHYLPGSQPAVFVCFACLRASFAQAKVRGRAPQAKARPDDKQVALPGLDGEEE